MVYFFFFVATHSHVVMEAYKIISVVQLIWCEFFLNDLNVSMQFNNWTNFIAPDDVNGNDAANVTTCCFHLKKAVFIVSSSTAHFLCSHINFYFHIHTNRFFFLYVFWLKIQYWSKANSNHNHWLCTHSM